MGMTSHDPSIPRVGVDADAPVTECLQKALQERFLLCAGNIKDCAVRVVTAAELEQRGPRLMRQHRLRYPDVPLVVITENDADAGLVRDCFRHGAFDVLPEDEVDSALARTVERAIAHVQSGNEREDEAQRMAAELGKRARDLETALNTVRESYDQTLVALVGALDCKEKETACHSQRVAIYSVLIGVRMGLSEEALENLFRGALLHDIGKIGIPDAVLLKPGSFTDEEWVIMKTHTEIGSELLRGIYFLHDAADVPRSHHEAWDGSGYPTGLVAEDIPVNARIFAVVDSYDAIRSKRPYKEAMTHEEAIPLLQDAKNQRLDPDIVDTFSIEPQSTWIQLEDAVGENITFEIALQSCRGVPEP